MSSILTPDERRLAEEVTPIPNKEILHVRHDQKKARRRFNPLSSRLIR